MSLISDIHADLENGAVRLITEYRARLFADAVQLCGNSTDAEDLVSRTFLKVLGRIDQHRPDGDFYGWMKAILTNIYRDDQDRPVTRGTVAVDAATLERYAGADTSTDDQILANSDRDALREAISQLEPEYRQAVAMYYFNELSLKEIAVFLNSSTSSVSRKLEVARKILAAKLETKLGKKPLAVLLAALLGVGSLFGAWKAAETIWPEAFSSASEAELVTVEDPLPQEETVTAEVLPTVEPEDDEPTAAETAGVVVRAEPPPATDLKENQVTQEQVNTKKKEGKETMGTKKLMLAAVGAAVAANVVAGRTLNVPAEYETIEAAVAMAQSGDEIVLAKSMTPYELTKKLTLPADVSVRGETGDFSDVIISGRGTLGGAFTLNDNSSVSNVTFTLFRDGLIISNAGWGGPYNIVNCRFTAITNSTNYGCKIIGQQGKGAVSRIVIDNCRIGCYDGEGLVGSTYGSVVFDQLVITNNFVQFGFGDTSGHAVFLKIINGGTVKNSFIGNNTFGTVCDLDLAKGTAYGPIVTIGGNLQNCVVVGNTFTGYATGLGAVNSTSGSVKDCLILENGLGADNWTLTGGSRYSYCLSTATETMTSSVEGDWGDVVAKPGQLPWLPYGSKAIGAGSNGGDIGRLWTPETLQCAVKSDRRMYIGAATARLLALASEEADFTWTLVSGPAALIPNGKDATLVFNGLGTVVVRVTATTANETATDEIALVSTQPVYEVTTAAELVEAVDAAQDGAEIVIAAGDYAPMKTLVLRNAVTVRGATGRRSDVNVSGSNARRVFTIDHPGAVISSLTVKNGVAGTVAGGVCLEVGGTLTNVCITGCRATGWAGAYEDANWHFNAGGAVANFNGKVLDCDFAANTQTVNNNAIIAYGQHGSLAFADRLVVTNNTSTPSATSNCKYRSAPVAITGGGTMRNSFIAYNNVNQPNGGAAYKDACGVFVHSGRLENSTIFRNRAHADYLDAAPGVYLTANGTTVSCVVTENGDADGNLSNYAFADGAVFDYCATAPVPEGVAHCVDYSAEPATLYGLDAAGYPIPKVATPTIDKGDDMFDWIAQAVDLYGNPRRQGESVDIGAYEAKPSSDALLCELVVAGEKAIAEPYDMLLKAAVSGTRTTGLSFEWLAIRTFKGIVTTNTASTADSSYVFTGLQKGDYTFAVTVTNDHEPQPDVATSVSDEGALHLSPAICYVSPTGSHVWPYDTQETASTNFVDVAEEARGRIVILPGAYENLPHVTDADGKDFVGIFDRAISIEGPSDPRAATINCAGMGGFKVENGGAVLSGVTFTNFAVRSAQSALTIMEGLASNIVVDACNMACCQAANDVNVGAGAVLSDSVLTGIKSKDWAGYVLSCKGGLVRNLAIVSNRNESTSLVSLAYDSASRKRARMESCTIADNSSGDIIRCSASVVEDCIAEGNKVAQWKSVLFAGSDTVFRRCRVLRNTNRDAAMVSVGSWNKDAPACIDNCLIAGNEVTSGSHSIVKLPANSSSGMAIINTTIADNRLYNGAGVDYGYNVGVSAPNVFMMTNSIVSGNFSGVTESNVVGTAIAPMIAHSCYSEADEADGSGNIAQNPQLRTFGRKIYRPRQSSPCVGTGDATLWTVDDIDLAGNPRLRKGKVDMGCYQIILQGLMLRVK